MTRRQRAAHLWLWLIAAVAMAAVVAMTLVERARIQESAAPAQESP